MTEDQRTFLSTTEAAERLSVSDETVKRYFAAGHLKGFKLPGGYYRIDSASIDALMNGEGE